MILLGVNIDHIATLRNARGDFFPSIVYAASIVEQNGGDFITIHLREDRRHIKDDDLFLLVNNVTTYINLEMACNDDILEKALKAKPKKVTLVPEKREEITTEGGLDVKNNFSRIKDFVTELKKNKIEVSLFIEPDISSIDTFLKTGAKDIEIHTGRYSISSGIEKEKELKKIKEFTEMVKRETDLRVCAGHGLNYHNVLPICNIKGIEELNIGYSIITYAIFNGLGNAVKKMKDLIMLSRLEKID
ncbi:MAG TPA: pyridoxine 5'-phosphate synthase [Spirochaetota bacterium]|mgnify:CR=1 FL=1|nr:pyridoxine 5'-phosphate synthase [Spirochaetota bacterium]HOL57481.1 pyridoxine 5'-phosphate synthase [Spirochaetota bacterium]HPP05036.1 pyridoxine 5'-phosphate synthase [Spirochaetota bacterium]